MWTWARERIVIGTERVMLESWTPAPVPGLCEDQYSKKARASAVALERSPGLTPDGAIADSCSRPPAEGEGDAARESEVIEVDES